jgi:hypothetical protein
MFVLLRSGWKNDTVNCLTPCEPILIVLSAGEELFSTHFVQASITNIGFSRNEWRLSSIAARLGD